MTILTSKPLNIGQSVCMRVRVIHTIQPIYPRIYIYNSAVH